MIDVTVAPCRAPSARVAASSSSGPMSDAGVLIRSRASQTASTMARTRARSTPAGSFRRAGSPPPFGAVL